MIASSLDFYYSVVSSCVLRPPSAVTFHVAIKGKPMVFAEVLNEHLTQAFFIHIILGSGSLASVLAPVIQEEGFACELEFIKLSKKEGDQMKMN